jgi:hypothetical protein
MKRLLTLCLCQSGYSVMLMRRTSLIDEIEVRLWAVTVTVDKLCD